VYNKELEHFELLLRKGESLTFKHRFLVAAEDLDDEKILELFQDFTTR
jgi:rubrerythrin